MCVYRIIIQEDKIIFLEKVKGYTLARSLSEENEISFLCTFLFSTLTSVISFHFI